ncbi:hypothetical protein BYT27DRAFT_7104439, partial [Phlegmacium glaucopus]
MTHDRSLGHAALASRTPAESTRSSSPLVESSPSGLVSDTALARSFLESRLLLVPEGHPVTMGSLAAMLFQVAALDKIPREVAQAIRAAAYLLDEIEEGAIAAMAREAVNDQLTYMNDELKTLTDHLGTVLEKEMEKQLESFSTAVKGLAVAPNKSFKDALLSGGPAPPSVDPRILAREGIKARQFLVDFLADSGIRELSLSDVSKKFNKAIIEAGGNVATHKIRSVERLANSGILGEFLTDDGAKWLAQQSHADDFIAAFGALGLGASIKKRNHPVIAYYVPLHLNTSNPIHFSEIEEINGMQKGDLLKIRWAKPPIRRTDKQTCSHLILTFSNPDAANRAKAKGLIICNKKVSAAKYKKEPIHCLKCQGWNHVASECIRKDDICGTCGNEGHRTSDCMNRDRHRCVSCGTDDHPSWARHCPTFLRKCREFDLKHPENGLPFYPSQESWTWASEPPRTEHRSYPNTTDQVPIQPRAGTQRLCQQQLRFSRTSASGTQQTSTIAQVEAALSSSSDRQIPTNSQLIHEPQLNRLRLLQLNINKSQKAHLDLINGPLGKNWDLILIQEPYITTLGHIRTPNGFTLIAPQDCLLDGAEPTRSVIWVNSKLSSNSWKAVNISGNNDITAMQI